MTRYPPSQCRRGLSTVKVMAAFPAVIMMAWLGAEVGLAARAVGQARSAADAIALAAAARSRDGHAAARADALAAAAASRGPNGPVQISIGDGPAGGQDVEFGRWDESVRAFVSDPEGGDAVRVRVRFAADHPNGTTSPVLSGLFGADSMSIERVSVAVHVPARHTTSLLVTGAAGVTLSLADTSSLAADGGITLASADMDAAHIAEGAHVVASVVRVAGAIDPVSAARVDALVMDGFAAPPDPFVGMALPLIDSLSASPIPHDDAQVTRVAPGAHQSLALAGGTVVLEAGLHQFVGDLVITGGALVLEDATVHLDASASLVVSGTGTLSGTPMSTGDWAGMCIIQRDATGSWALGGAGPLTLGGSLYAPQSALSVVDGMQASLDSAIVGSVSLGGTAALELVDRIDQLSTVPVPGRARLVR